MKKLLSLALVLTLLLGISGIGAAAFLPSGLSAEEQAQYDQIMNDFYAWAEAQRWANLAASTYSTFYWLFDFFVDEPMSAALKDESKVTEFLEEMGKAMDAANASAARVASSILTTNETLRVIAFFAGTLKSELESTYSAYLDEISNELEPVLDTYLKADFLDFMASFSKIMDISSVISNSDLTSEQEVALFFADAADYMQLIAAANWAAAKAAIEEALPLILAIVNGAALFDITYNANAGAAAVTGLPGKQTKIAGVTLDLSSGIPVRAGYTFKGWATSATGAVVYASGASYTANAAVTLYAVWEANPAPKEYFSLWGKTTTWEKSPLNWILLILCFGWIWMSF